MDRAPSHDTKVTMIKAPLYRAAYVMGRLLQHDLNADRVVLNELWDVLQEDVAMMVYCNPVAIISLQPHQMNPMSFHVSKDTVKNVMRCIKQIHSEFSLKQTESYHERIIAGSHVETLRTLLAAKLFS